MIIKVIHGFYVAQKQVEGKWYSYYDKKAENIEQKLNEFIAKYKK